MYPFIEMIPEYLKPMYAYTLQVIDQLDVTLIMSEKDAVYLHGLEYNGYFIQKPATLAVAAGQDPEIWVPIFVHESCHMDQWWEGSSYWKNAHIDNIECLDLVNLWIRGVISLDDVQLKDIMGRARDLEWDCEKRTIQKIKQYNLPFDVIEYTKRSNAYIYFYNILAETRRWYVTGEEPYLLDDIWKYMPDNFDGEYSMTPSEVRNVFKPWFPELK